MPAAKAAPAAEQQLNRMKSLLESDECDMFGSSISCYLDSCFARVSKSSMHYLPLRRRQDKINSRLHAQHWRRRCIGRDGRYNSVMHRLRHLAVHELYIEHIHQRAWVTC